jgi:excisionase family DNA binding protein
VNAAASPKIVAEPLPAGAYLKVTELAARWNVSAAHIWQLVHSKRLGSVLIGRSRRIPEECAEAFIRAGLCPANGEDHR